MSDPGPCGCPQALALQALLVEALEFIDHRELCQMRDPLEKRGCDCGLVEVLLRIEEMTT